MLFILKDPRLKLPARLGQWLPEILLVAVTTGAGLWAGGRCLTPVGDVGIWWSLISRLAGGQRLYRDVYIQYGPFSPYFLSLGARLFGPSSTYLLLSSWSAAVVCGLLVLRLGRRFLSAVERLAVVGLLLGLSLFAPGVGRLVLPYAPAAVHALGFALAALLLLDSSGHPSNRRTLLVGVLAGLAFCSKQEIGVAAAISLGGFFLLERKRGFRLVWALAGFVGVSLLGAVVVLWSAPEPALWRRNHLWPLAWGVPKPWRDLFRIMLGVSDPQWALLLRGTAWALLGAITVLVSLGLLFAGERRARTWLPVVILAAILTGWWALEGYLLADRFWPATLSLLVSLAVAALALTDRQLPKRGLLFAFALFACFNGTRSAFSPDLFGPYAKVAQLCASLTWPVFLCILVPRVLAPGEKAAASARRLLTLCLLLVSWRAGIRGVAALSPLSVEPFATPLGTVFVDSDHRLLFAAIRREVRPGEAALILPDVNGVDVLFGLRDLSPYLIHVPGWLDEDAEAMLIRRFEEKPPDVVILFNRSTWLFRTAPFGRGYGRTLAQWIALRYRPVQVLPAGTILRPPGIIRALSSSSDQYNCRP